MKIDPPSTVPGTLQYDRDLSELKSEVDELKKLLTQYGKSNVPNTVPDSIASARFAIASNQKPKPNIDPTTTQRLTWTKFFNTVGMEALTATEAQKEENIADRAEQIARRIQAAKEQGLGEWVVKVAGRSFVALLTTYSLCESIEERNRRQCT